MSTSTDYEGGERRAFVGISPGGTPDDPASLHVALADAAERAVRAGAVTKDAPVWYEVSRLQVEMANQHVRTFVVHLTPSG